MDILTKLKQQICRVNVTIDEKNIPVNEGLMKSGIIDSFGFVELVTYIENEFGIEFEDNEINDENFKNLIEIAKFIEKKLRVQLTI